MATSEGFSPEIQKVIDSHKNDFYYKNYSSKVKNYGDYVNSLSSFFKETRTKINNGEKVTTVEQFQRRVNYVMGLMAIWGFDYYNGKTYWRWGEGVKSTGDAFYTGSKKGKCNSGTIGVLCQGTNGKSRTTNCNYGVDTLLHACNIYKVPSAYYKKMVTEKKGTLIKNKSQIQVGDMIHFFGSNIDSNNVGTWKNWKHVAMVYNKTDKYIILADFGNRFIKNKKPFHYMDRKSVEQTGKAGGAYSGYGKNWSVVRLYNFKNQPAKEKMEAGQSVEIANIGKETSNETTEAISETPLAITGVEDNTTININYQEQPWLIPMPRLTKGSEGKAVKIWQIIVGEYNKENKPKIDGQFGNKTQVASKIFQEKHGFTIDGIIDSKEWEKGLYSLTLEH